MTGVLKREGERDLGQRHTGKMPDEDRSRDWSEMTTRQQMPRTAGSH